MATAERPKYMWIPPPPLPEFYLPKETVELEKKPSSASSSSGTEADETVRDEKKSVQVIHEKAKRESSRGQEKQQPFAVDGAYDGLPSAFRYVGAAHPPSASRGNNVPPLAIYHICRLCLRPRSARYHREHPIPVNGVPPPPGICRRCRVTAVQEVGEGSELKVSEVDEVIRKGRSNEIKLGLDAFIPDEDLISSEEAKRMHAQRYLRGRSSERHITIFREASSERRSRYRRSRSRRSDIVYRHVKVVEEPTPEPEPKTTVKEQETAASRATRPASRERVRMRFEREAEQTVIMHRTDGKASSKKSRAPLESANLAQLDNVAASKSSQHPASASILTSATVSAKQSVKDTVYLKRPDRTDSEIRKIASEEAQRYAAELKKDIRPESEVRRIAHEEVERYRAAERKLEARPDGFAHGRLVPVPREIEAKPSEPPQMPWQNVPEPASPVAIERSQISRKLESVPSIKSTSYGSHHSPVRSERESWGPQWRRELSVERRKSSEVHEESWRVDVTEEARSKVSAPPSDLPKSDKSRSAYDAVPGSNASTRNSNVHSQVLNNTQKEPAESARKSYLDTETDMGLLFSPRGRPRPGGKFDHERETVERLGVRTHHSVASRQDANPALSERSTSSQAGMEEASTTFKKSGAGSTSPSSTRSSATSRQRGSADQAASLARKHQAHAVGVAPVADARRVASERHDSGIQYEYRLHTVRPADRPGDMRPRLKDSPQPSQDPSHVTLEIWQQVPTDPVQRAREAARHEKERLEAVEWLKTRVDDPNAKVGVDADGSIRLACSIPHRGSDKQRPRSPEASQHQPPRQPAPPKERSSRREPEIRSKRSSGTRGGANDDRADWPDRELLVEVWEQMPTKDAARFRRQAAENARQRDGGGYVIEAWKQVPGDRQPSNVRRDSAMEIPPSRRRRERREAQGPSEDSAHVKFASKIEISPTPPGSDESSNAFRRFHDFMGRKAGRQQIDGHESEEHGEDIIAEYERRGRLRSREPARRKSQRVYDSRGSRERDSTVRPSEDQRRYEGKRDDRWHPLQRVLSESPSREWSDRKRSSVKNGPPYHPTDERPSGSMTTHEGSRIGGKRDSWW